ncbi:hypothetical protein HPB50_008369 [Hyalomma asiaticum]|uniref:Uncharacterized protein n=1 Tax=Hyalomma asiaticum TaxID=266040 RepID=A0ACB7RW87_HYAAI|nr:hypothetical protein HPB50_008369 [Hyalomma asiaticum]
MNAKPFPRNIQLEKNERRRTARAKAPARQLEENPKLCADASLRKHDNQSTAVATSINKLIVSASLWAIDPAIAEGASVAIALVQASVDTVVADSKSAYGSFRRGVFSPAAQAILSKEKPLRRAIELVCIPVHEPTELPHPVTSFKDIT